MNGRRKPATSSPAWDRAVGPYGYGGWTDLPRLRAIGVVLPVAFILAIELIRCIVVEGSLAAYADHIVLAVVTVVSVIAFAAVMFRLIERAQREVVRQNRELAAANAVSTAVQGELGVDEIIDAALESVLASSGASEASVTVFAPEGQPPGEGGRQRRLAATPSGPRPAKGSGAHHIIDIPLSTGASVVGRLRLHMPEEADRPNLLTQSTLQNIGHQLACSIQIGQLVADLRRRQREGHGLYAVLLQVSNQKALADTLATVVRYARDLLASDEANLWLNDPAARSVQLEGALWGAAALDDGTVCVYPQPDRLHDLHEVPLARSARPSPEFRETLAVSIRSPAGTLGELWIGRRSEAPFTERDRRYLVTLSDLASIAITSARMRENERLGAMLAERERIAREMHDGLAQVLGATHLRLRALGSRPEVLATRAITAELDELAELSEEAYRDVREAILGLRESSRTDRGLLESLRAYLDKFSHQCGIGTSLETTLDRDLVFAPRSELQVIRVIQEALTNVRKHSGATLATVRIGETDHTATFVVEDDGRGFDLAGALLGRDGFGLHTMRERMELIGGTLRIDSAPGRGTRVIAGCPWHSRSTSTSPGVNIAGN